MREKRTITIGDSKYVIEQLGAWDSLKATHILGKVLSPAFAEMYVADDKAAAEEWGRRLGGIFDRLTDEDREALLKLFAKGTQVTTEQMGGAYQHLSDVFDSHFTGKRMAHLVKWVVEFARLNFSDFLDELKTLFQGETAPEEERQESQST